VSAAAAGCPRGLGPGPQALGEYHALLQLLLLLLLLRSSTSSCERGCKPAYACKS
jgi:hypothetical protein